MRKILTGLCLAAALVALPAVGFAEYPYDFSDLANNRLDLPFTVTSMTYEANTVNMFGKQIYHVTESYDKVIKKLGTMYDKQQRIGIFYILGLSKQTTPNTHSLMIGYNNEHHYVTIQAEGSGTVFIYETAPASYVSGVYDAAIYGYHLPDGGAILTTINSDE